MPGLGWANPYDERVWDYVLSIAKAAARAGFDEIQFDYVRFPSDGPIESAVFPGKTAEPPGWTIARFVQLRVEAAEAARRAGLGRRLRPLGDARPRHRPEARTAREVRRRGLPDGLSRRTTTRASSTCPTRAPTPGRTVALSLRDFRNAMVGRKAMLIPWLEDFSLTSDRRPPEEVQAQIDAARRHNAKGLPALEPERRLHGGTPQVGS